MHLAQGGVEQEAQESSTKKTICCHAESLLASFAPKNAELCRRPRAAERGFGALLWSRRAAGISSGISPFSCWPVSAPDPGDQLRDGINKKPGGRPTAHFSTVFPLEKTRMVIDGAAERRLQAIHRDRCTWWRAMVPPWCIHSLVRSLVCRVDRRPAAASDLHRWLGARCELPHEDDWVSSAGSGAQRTTC